MNQLIKPEKKLSTVLKTSVESLEKPIKTEAIAKPESSVIISNKVIINKPIIIDKTKAEKAQLLFYYQNNTIYNHFILTNDCHSIRNQQGENYREWFLLKSLEESEAQTSANVNWHLLFNKIIPFSLYNSRNHLYKKLLLDYLNEKFGSNLGYKDFIKQALDPTKFNLVSNDYFWIGNRIEYLEKDEETDDVITELSLNMVPNTNLFSKYMLNKAFNEITIVATREDIDKKQYFFIIFNNPEMETFLLCIQNYIQITSDISNKYGTIFIANKVERKECNSLLSFTFYSNNYKIHIYYAKNINISRDNFANYLIEKETFILEPIK